MFRFGRGILLSSSPLASRPLDVWPGPLVSCGRSERPNASGPGYRSLIREQEKDRLMKFSEMGLAEPVLKAIEVEGYHTPSPIQAQAIPVVMSGRDVLGCAQTGTGKTAAFALPTIHRLINRGNPPKGHGRKIRALVIAPTRELANQICDSFLAYGKNTPLRTIAIYGGVSQGLQVRALRHGVDILIATPGRLVDLMGQGYVDLGAVETLVLDEADRMFDMGFAPDLKRIIQRLPEERQNLLFSATMPKAIKELADAILKDPVRIEIIPERTPLEIIAQSLLRVPTKSAKARVLAAYLKSVPMVRAIVFTRTKHGADRVTRGLVRYGFSTDAIHGDKRQNVRQRTLDAFKTNRIQVLVATDIAARGIDVDNVTHVVNFDMPLDPETYVHRVGRTGRAGAGGTALSLCIPEEKHLLYSIERLIGKRIEPADFDIKNLPPMEMEPADEMDGPDEFDEDEGSRHDRRRPRQWGGNPEESRFRGLPRVRAARQSEDRPFVARVDRKRGPEFGGSRGSAGMPPMGDAPQGDRSPPVEVRQPNRFGANREQRPAEGGPPRREFVPGADRPRKAFRPGSERGAEGQSPKPFRESRLPGKGGTVKFKRKKKSPGGRGREQV